MTYLRKGIYYINRYELIKAICEELEAGAVK